MPPSTLISTHAISIEIGDIPICVRTESREFARMLKDRYGEFVSCDPSQPVMELEIRLLPESELASPERRIRNHEADIGNEAQDEVSVQIISGRWVMERGDFRAEWDPECRRGWVRQSQNPYAIDSVLRILHSLMLARRGGFLVHAASAVRNGRAYVFAGESGAGKTTLSRLAPPDVTILTDEISYVKARDKERGIRDSGDIRSDQFQSFEAFGTPFAGELARIGQRTRAPLAGFYMLKQGPENRIEQLSDSEAAWELFRHVLFFARDEELVQRVFKSILEFVGCIPVRRMIFAPNAGAWELIA